MTYLSLVWSVMYRFSPNMEKCQKKNAQELKITHPQHLGILVHFKNNLNVFEIPP